MQIWQRFFKSDDQRAAAPVDASLLRSLRDLADHEKRPAEEVITSLLNQALQERQLAEEHWKRWQKLTRREQEVAALVCLNHTSRQVAALLVISPETVKTHVGHLLRKFDLSTRQELRQALAGWDFSDWEKPVRKN